VNFWNIFQSRPPRTASRKPVKPATSARTAPPTPAPSQHHKLDTLAPIVAPAPLNKLDRSYTNLPNVTLTGRPYTAPHATRMTTGVGIYPGRQNYVAAQFSDSAKNMLLSEVSANLNQRAVPAENAHLTLIPPSDQLDVKQTTRALFEKLNHGTLVFKRVVITHRGAILLIPEDTTSARELKKQVTKIANAKGLPHQTRDLHILLGHVDTTLINPKFSPGLSRYPEDHPAFAYRLPLVHPFTLKLGLTAEGTMISEQITAQLQKIPSDEAATSDQITTDTLCFSERAANVEMLADTFLRNGSLSEEDYLQLKYDYVRPDAVAYRNNPIYFTPEMLRKAREEGIPLSYQMVPLSQISALTAKVGSTLKYKKTLVDYPQTDGSTTPIEMATIQNPELIVQAFQRDLQRVFGYFDDVVVQQVGSGVTGFSRNPDKPVKPCDTVSADIDLAVKSRQIIEHLDREQGMTHVSVNRKIKLANKYTVIANSPKAEDEIGLGDTPLGKQIKELSQTWSALLAGQSPEDNELDPVVDFKLNIAPNPFQEAATLLDMRKLRPPAALDRVDDLKVKPTWTSWLVGPQFFM
jgi:hypothetical protein